jgi:predicted nucleic acid-binding protein
VRPCVLDTDVVIAALDRSDLHHIQAVAIVKDLIEANVERLLSTINYAEALVRPAGDEQKLRTAVDAIDAMGIDLVAPTPAMARDAARLRGSSISLADGFALATARASGAAVASFDRRVQRALKGAGLDLAAALR